MTSAGTRNLSQVGEEVGYREGLEKLGCGRQAIESMECVSSLNSLTESGGVKTGHRRVGGTWRSPYGFQAWAVFSACPHATCLPSRAMLFRLWAVTGSWVVKSYTRFQSIVFKDLE